MQLLSKYKWLGLLGLVVTLVFVIGLGGLQAAKAFSGITPPYFFANDAGQSNPAGETYLTGFGAPGSQERPTGIVFAHGEIFVADHSDDSLYEFSLAGGNPINGSPHLIAGCSGPIGLTRIGGSSLSGGSLYIVCNFPAAIYPISFAGVLGPPLTAVNAIGTIAFDLTTTKPTAGSLLVSSVGPTPGVSSIFQVSTAGAVTTCATNGPGGALSTPDGIVVDYLTNTIYASNVANNTVAQIPPKPAGGVCGGPATLLTTVPFPVNTGPDGIAVGLPNTECQDTLYVNTNNGNLYPVTISTGMIGNPIIATGGSRGDLVKVSPFGYLFATQSDHVAKIGPPCFQSGPCLTFAKATDPAGVGFGFTWTGPSSLGAISLDDGEAYTNLPCDPGTYILDESPKPGWTLTNIVCTGASGDTTITFNSSNGISFMKGDTGVTIVLGGGDQVICTFTNTAPCALPGGLNISTGTDLVNRLDPRWTVNSGPAYRAVPRDLEAPLYFGTNSWVTAPLAPVSRWIHATNTGESDTQILFSRTYVYVTNFTVPAGAFTLNLQYAADNNVSFDLSGPLPFAGLLGFAFLGGNLTPNFHTLNPVIAAPLMITAAGNPSGGTYTLTATVTNDSTGTPSGLLVAGTVTCGTRVGGIVGLTVSSSGSPVPWPPLAAAGTSVMAVMGVGLWYGRRRWFR